MMVKARVLSLLTVLLLVVPLRAQQPPKPADPELAEFRTVDNAITTRISRSLTPSTGSLPAYLGLQLEKDARGGLLVSHVDLDSPAARAGIQKGDLLGSVGGKVLADTGSLRQLLRSKTPGESLKVSVVRKEGKTTTIEVTLGAVSAPLSATAGGGGPRSGRGRATLGISVEPSKEGIRIAQVTRDSSAEKAGLKAGDLLVKVAGTAIDSSDKLTTALSNKRPGETVTLVIKRAGKEQEVKATLSGGQGGGAAEAWDARRSSLFRKDTYNLAVIPIEYPDVKHNPKIKTRDWENALFSRGTYTDKSVTGDRVYGSMNDYYLDQSCGALKVTGKVFAHVTVAKKREEYGGTGSNRTALLSEAVDKLLARDGAKALDGFDGIFFLYSGNRVQTQRGGLYWPHRSSFSYKGKRWGYFICPEGGEKMASISVISHEFGHMLGLPDLYARPEVPGQEGLGVWCTMSTGHGRDGKPLHFSAWCKEKMGWIKPAVIDPTVKQKLILSPIESSTRECYKVLLQPDGSEYLLLENRMKRGFDRDLPAEGLLIWRVVNDRPILEESHGIAGPIGPQRFLNSVPYPSKSNNAFTPLTVPSSKALTGGGLPVHITNIRRLPDGRITFFIGYESF